MLRLRGPPDCADDREGDNTALCRLSMPCCCSCACSFWAGDLRRCTVLVSIEHMRTEPEDRWVAKQAPCWGIP